MHMPAAYAYRISFSSTFRFADEGKSDRLYIGSASGKFVAGPNAGVAFNLSDIELEKERVEGGVAVYGTGGSQLVQSVSLENGVKFQRVCAATLRISR